MVARRKKAAVKKPSNLPEIHPVSAMETGLAVLIYGKSGTGKTTCSSTFPKKNLLLDIRERGTDSISNVKGVEVAEITSWEQVEEVYWYLESGSHDYETVTIDQLTALQDLAVEKAKKDNGKSPEDPTAQRDWGDAAGLMKTWILNYRDLIDKNINVVFLSHDREHEGEEVDDERLAPTVGPRVMPSVASFLTGAVKMIGNTFISERFTVEGGRKKRIVEYAMRIGPHAIYTTKTRSPVGVNSPDILVDPTYDKLVAVMKGEYSEEKPAAKSKTRVRRRSK